MILKYYFTTTLLLLVSLSPGFTQCDNLSINDLLLLSNTPNHQIFESFLNQREFSFKDRKFEDRYLKYQYTSNDQSMMIEYSETFEGDEHIILISIYLKERSMELLLEDMNDSGWIKYGKGSQDSKGWVNQLYTNPKIPGFSIIYGEVNDGNSNIYRIIL